MMRMNGSHRAMHGWGFIVAALVAITAMLSTGSARAQVVDNGCPPCGHLVVQIDNNVTCKVGLCWANSPDGPIICTTFGAGDNVKIPCFKGQSILVQLCDGSTADITNLNACTNLRLAPTCCVQACPAIGICPTISITQIPCLGPRCP
ncbi:MAG TPA: hypothetical protein VHI13_06735 [Candidatus Kapabacteria bacterium]|nr:hypothetical protein [Candidatus Kapabacteria bacterium]